MFVPVSRCHLRNCVCCVMVLPVFVTYVPESALFTADRAAADVDETLVHVAYMHICSRGSGVTCLRRRDLLRLKSQHCRLNTDQGVKVITHTTTISSSFDMTKVVNKRNAVLRLLWIVSRLLSGLILGSPLTKGLMARIVLGLMLKSDMSIYSKIGTIIVY